MSQDKRSLWRSFITIAQPYFFPGIRGGGLATLLLMVMLLVFLFGLLVILVGTGITALIGRRLVRLNFNQLRFEVDFRYSLVHVRDNASVTVVRP
jgi:putative ATP-binding cassette transporter